MRKTIWFVWVCFWLSALTLVSYGQQSPLTSPAMKLPAPAVKLAHPADSKDVQLDVIKEKNLQLQFQILQRNYQDQQAQLESQYRSLESKIEAWIAQVRKDNDLGDDVQYDRDRDAWVKVPVKPKPAPPVVKK